MILPGHLIRLRNIFTPFNERTVHNGMSYGLSSAGYDIRCQQAVSLASGQFALACSMEHFTMPTDLLGIVHDKSTWARRGLALQNTVIEPGWRGFLTLELTNHGRDRLEIAAGDPIAQIVFHALLEPAESPYSGKYQDQPSRPVPALLEPLA